MKTLTARFRSNCRGCNAEIAPGATILFEPGKGSFCREECTRMENPEPLSQVKGSTSRSYGARSTRGRSRYGSSYTRFSSGAEVYTNRAGRCEDAPCCGCCS